MVEAAGFHIPAKFVPPRCQLYVDNACVLDYEDKDWLENLRALVLYSYPIHQFDNVRIYHAADARREGMSTP